MQPEVQLPDTTALATEGTELAVRAAALTITSQPEYASAGEELRRIARLTKSVQAVFKDLKEAANQTHKKICAAEKGLLTKPAAAEQAIRRAMSEYLTEEEQKRRVEQARLQAAAHVQSQKARAAEAELLAAAGDTEAGVALLEEQVPAPVIELEKPKAEGISTRKKWCWEIYDAAAVKPDWLTPDEKKIGKTVGALGADAASMVGGIRVWEEIVPVARS